MHSRPCIRVYLSLVQYAQENWFQKGIPIQYKLAGRNGGVVLAKSLRNNHLFSISQSEHIFNSPCSLPPMEQHTMHTVYKQYKYTSNQSKIYTIKLTFSISGLFKFTTLFISLHQSLFKFSIVYVRDHISVIYISSKVQRVSIYVLGWII